MKYILKEFNLDEKIIKKLCEFKKIFLEYNKKINLTSRKSIENFDLINLKDSIGLIKFKNFKKNQNILDIGTGGGFPGFVLAIIFSKTNFYLNDSNTKKINWIKFAKEKLKINNIFLINERVENIDETKNEFFDVIITRAFGKIDHTFELSLRLLKIKGEFIFYKGKNYNDELIYQSSLIQNEQEIKLLKIEKWNFTKEILRFFIFYIKIEKKHI